MTQGRLPFGGRSDPRRIGEKAFQGQVIDLLTVMGWSYNHCYALRTEHGWRTGYTAVGFPDLCCFRGEYIVGIEVKGFSSRGDAGRLTPQQVGWLQRFAEIPTGRAWLLTPLDPDFDRLVDWVRHPADAPRRYGYTTPT
jgi:hypothetical protein